jgi:uncharacterized protein YijF (DUF1287 family)
MHALALLAALAAGLPDRGIFSDLDGAVALAAPSVPPARARLREDRLHGVLTLYDGADPVKAYPLPLRDADRAELAPIVGPRTPRLDGPPPRAEDRDGDGIVDRLDVLLGAKKLLGNRARYEEHYRTLRYPGGDVPRREGVCTDTIVRALRNAGIDLQRELHEDILAAPRAYPMVARANASIDHRRVRTLLPWLTRHFSTVRGPFRPGDIVLFDTFPSRPGPDHIGIVSDTIGPHGLPLVVNNWTEGTVDAEMDLLAFVPVTHHFRAP